MDVVYASWMILHVPFMLLARLFVCCQVHRGVHAEAAGVEGDGEGASGGGEPEDSPVRQDAAETRGRQDGRCQKEVRTQLQNTMLNNINNKPGTA